MRGVLVAMVKCYGFGAVVEEDAFEGVVEEWMGGLEGSDRMQE